MGEEMNEEKCLIAVTAEKVEKQWRSILIVTWSDRPGIPNEYHKSSELYKTKQEALNAGMRAVEKRAGTSSNKGLM